MGRQARSSRAAAVILAAVTTVAAESIVVRPARTAAAGASLPIIPAAEALQRRGPIARAGGADGADLVGTAAPALPAIPWLDGRRRDLASLAGSVVLIRAFTNACPFCSATLPSLERLHDDLGGRGLEVLGVYHPKPPRPVVEAEVAALATAMGISFPVGIDADWRFLQEWWTGRADNGWTSITWVLDRAGTIRYVHPGGEFHEAGGADHARCRRDAAVIRVLVERLLDEPLTPPRPQLR